VVDEVTVVVEGRRVDDAGWQVYANHRLEPRGSDRWPLEFLTDVDIGRSYLLTATGLDERYAVVAQARTVRELDGEQDMELWVLFETSCLRRAQLCERGETCHQGACVDARDLLP
jgi:hypothetical protein